MASEEEGKFVGEHAGKRVATSGQDPEKLANKASQLLRMLEDLGKMNLRNNDAEAPKAAHKFWSTQPVLQPGASIEDSDDGPFERPVALDQVRQEPFPLPAEFKWSLIDMNNSDEREEVYKLLNLNYVEDVESMFRFDYPPEFLEWALMPPGWRQEWHLGVRVSESNRLVAFISAIPCSLQVRAWKMESVEVNFLCIHKKLRTKRLAPLLIKEITRRVNLFGIFQALYTAGALLPGLIGKARYYHRPLNYAKLCETGFASVPIGRSMDSMISHFWLAKEPKFWSSIRPMTSDDVGTVTSLLETYLSKFPLRPILSEEEVRHWLLPRDEIIYSYVCCNDENKATDFISFYSLPSTVVNSEKHSKISVAYLFYYAAHSENQLEKMVNAALVLAKNSGFDVFNCVEILENGSFLKSLKFGEGDGDLHYYLFNWRTRPFDGKDVAIVML